MSVAEQEKPVEAAARPLWPNTPSGAELRIEVFGATGEYKSGKTLLGLSIAPGVHPEGHRFAGQARTLLLDFEKSGGTYGGTGCQRIDVPQKLLDAQGGTYRPLDTFCWFRDLVEQKLRPGQFDVIVADPITDIESGLVDWVKANHDQFALTRNQVDKGGGLLWGVVKDYWKQVLLKIGAKCQCFYFTSHLRQVWQGNQPTGRREPKGKETLMELASLYLWLERKPDKDGKVPAVPSAIVLKERLADTRMNDDGELEVIQLMPPRLPEATAGSIRKYVSSPPNYSRLKQGERVPEEEFTEEEKLRLELAKAEAERETEETRLARLGRQAELQAMARQAAAQKPQPSDRTGARQAEQQKARQEPTATAPAATVPATTAPASAQPNGRATAEQVGRVKQLVAELEVPREKLAGMLARAKAAKVSDLSGQQCGLLIDAMEREKAKREGNS